MDKQQEPTARDLFALLRRGLGFAIAVAVVAGAATYLLSGRADPVYRARASLLVSQPNPELRSFGVSLVTAPAVDVSAYRAAVSIAPVLDDAFTRLGTEGTPARREAFRARLRVRVEETRLSSLIHIELRGTDPARVTEETNAVATALIDWDRQRASENLRTIIATLESQIHAVDEQIRSLQTTGAAQTEIDSRYALREEQRQQLYYARTLETSAIGLLEIFEPAQTPMVPVAPNPLRNALITAVLAAVLAYALLFLRNALDTRFRGIEDLARSIDLPLLGEFPRQAGKLRRLPREASDYLRTNLLFATTEAHPKIVLITSAVSSQGKSSVAMSLAESFARTNHRTLLIDADIRKPVLGAEFKLSKGKHASLERHLETIEVEPQPITNIGLGPDATLDIMPSFDPAPAPLKLLSRGFPRLLERYRDRYDVIVVDSAPVLPVADTLAIAPYVTGVVLSVSVPDAERREVGAALELLRRIGVRMLGVVATNLATDGGKRGYGYGYGYGRAAKTGADPQIARSIPEGGAVQLTDRRAGRRGASGVSPRG